MGDCSCDPEEEFRQAQDALQKLAHRLADGRLRQVAQKIKQQQRWDNAPRHTEYEGHNANSGLIKPLGGGARQAQPISNGWLKPGDVVEIGNKCGFNFRPRARKLEEEEEVKRNLPLQITKEFVGQSYGFENFKAILQSRKNANAQFKDTDLKFSAIDSKDVFYGGIYRKNFTSPEEYQIIETVPTGFYLSFQAQKDFVFKEPNKQPKFSNSAGAYICNCKPKTIYKFISLRGTSQNLSFLFDQPRPEYRRSKCSDFSDYRIIKGNCDRAIEWRLTEVGVGGTSAVTYAIGKISEMGFLIIELDFPPIFSRASKIFASTYDYPGYMQMQIGCLDSASQTIKWQ
jgi:hypothetical protein